MSKDLDVGFHRRVHSLLYRTSAKAFAEKLGIHPSTLREVLRTGRYPRVEVVEKIAKGSGVSLDWLITGAGTGPAPPTPKPGAMWVAKASDKPMPLREGPPQSYGAASSKAITAEEPLTAEEAQFATFQVWREVVAATHTSMQRHGLLAKDIDPLDLADHVAKLVVEYARAAAKERKNLTRRLAEDNRILQLKKAKGRRM